MISAIAYLPTFFRRSFLTVSIFIPGGVVLELAIVSVTLAIGFIAGYGLRELQSRRRRARAKAEFLKKEEQRLYNDGMD
jgi:hypothetical protein